MSSDCDPSDNTVNHNYILRSLFFLGGIGLAAYGIHGMKVGYITIASAHGGVGHLHGVDAEFGGVSVVCFGIIGVMSAFVSKSNSKYLYALILVAAVFGILMPIFAVLHNIFRLIVG